MNRRMSRLLALAVAAGVLGFAAPAWADSTISINPGNVPTLAAAAAQECSANLGGGPFPGEDVWVFNLPGQHDTTGDFLSVTAVFSTPGGTVTRTIPTDGGAIVLQGTSKAWIRVPAGWTLIGATAVISGTATQFVLTHACKGLPTSPSPSPSASPSVSKSPSASPSASASASVSSSATPSASASVSLSPGGSPGVSMSPAAGGLPVTGSAVLGLVTAAGVFIVGGIGLLLLQYRRRTSDLS